MTDASFFLGSVAVGHCDRVHLFSSFFFSSWFCFAGFGLREILSCGWVVATVCRIVGCCMSSPVAFSRALELHVHACGCLLLLFFVLLVPHRFFILAAHLMESSLARVGGRQRGDSAEWAAEDDFTVVNRTKPAAGRYLGKTENRRDTVRNITALKGVAGYCSLSACTVLLWYASSQARH